MRTSSRAAAYVAATAFTLVCSATLGPRFLFDHDSALRLQVRLNAEVFLTE
jgi:hypothetical protein